jgi:hypothetical protein
MRVLDQKVLLKRPQGIAFHLPAQKFNFPFLFQQRFKVHTHSSILSHIYL